MWSLHISDEQHRMMEFSAQPEGRTPFFTSALLEIRLNRATI